MKCANLGIDEPYELAGRLRSIWRKTKRVASRGASALISTVKDSDIPGLSQAAALARSTGETLEREGWIPEILRTGSAASSSSAAPEDVAYAPAKDNTLLYVGVGAVALLLLLKRK